MIRNGIEGAATCAEIFEPHYGPNTLNGMRCLEAAIIADGNIKEIIAAFKGYCAMSWIAAPSKLC